MMKWPQLLGFIESGLKIKGGHDYENLQDCMEWNRRSNKGKDI